MTRSALVTGGTRGIGAEISATLKQAGYNVAATYFGNDDAAKAFADKTGVHVFKFDVADFDACQDGIAKAEAAIGPIDILVNNAGITRDAMLHKMTPEQWREVISTNLDSLFNMCSNIVEGMRQREFGRIVNISSINGQKGQAGQTNYSATKAGVIGFTRALAQETAKKGITVNSIAPGYVATDMVKAVPEEVLNSKILPNIPVGRLGEPSEIARSVMFLVAEDAGFITGSTLTVNGGQFLAA